MSPSQAGSQHRKLRPGGSQGRLSKCLESVGVLQSLFCDPPRVRVCAKACLHTLMFLKRCKEGWSQL